MRNEPDRAIFTVVRHELGWAVEFEGEMFDAGADKEVVKAAANKRARAVQDSGKPCQIRVIGEHGFFAAA